MVEKSNIASVLPGSKSLQIRDSQQPQAIKTVINPSARLCARLTDSVKLAHVCESLDNNYKHH